MNRTQRGAALLTVLLLVAVMTTVAVAVLDDVRLSVRRAGNAQAASQARWQAIAAETAARMRLRAQATATPGRTTLAGGWRDRAQQTAMPAGWVRVRASDGGACFNLNAVVVGAGDYLLRHDDGVRQFVDLARALGIPGPRAQALGDALADWIDADAVPAPAGVEDAGYALGSGGRLTGATLLAEVSELRAIAGFDAATYARLRPHVCALPVAGGSPVNINTLTARDWPVLAMASRGAIDRQAAAALLASRPAAGWASVAEFAAQPQLARTPLDPAAIAAFDVRTRYVALRVDVAHDGALITASSLLDVAADGRSRLLARRWTHDE